MHNLAVYNPQTHKFDVPIKIFDPNYTFNNRCFIDQSNKLWAVTPLSLRRYNSSTLALEDSIPMQGIFPPTSSCTPTESYGWRETAR